MSTLQNQKVSIAEKVGYGLGDCSANLVFQMMMIYQTKFYTDVFGLEAIGPRLNGESIVLGYFGQLYLSWYFMFWHSIIPALKIKDWLRYTLPFRIPC